jgi:hypothetical protein
VFLAKPTRSVAVLASLLTLLVGTAAGQGDRAKQGKTAPREEAVETIPPGLTAVRLPHDDVVTAAVFTPDGKRLLTASVGRKGASIRVWDPVRGKLLREWVPDPASVSGIAVAASPTGPLSLVTLHPNGFTVWDWEAGKVQRRIRKGTGMVPPITLSGDGTLVAFDIYNRRAQRALHVFDTATGKEIWVVPEGIPGTLVAVAPDFKRILMREGQALRLWEGGRDKVLAQQVADGVPPQRLNTAEAARAKSLQEFPCSGSGRPRASFSVDGKKLVVLDDEVKPVVWDTTTGKELRKWERGANDFFRWAALSADGRRLATLERSGRWTVWDLATGWRLLDSSVAPIISGPLVFSPDGRRFAARIGAGMVWVFDFVPGKDRLSAKELEELWKEMAYGDDPDAYRAALALAAAPKDAVPFLRERLRPLPPDHARLKRLVADLDDDSLARRDAASTELRQVGRGAEATLREARERAASAEVRQRIDHWLAVGLVADKVRSATALRTLELIGGEEARQALSALAEEKRDPWLADEAKAALDRLLPRPEKK